jgi:hypothetical protein
MNLQIIILDQFKPSSLAHVQIHLGEYILQVVVVGEDMDHIPKTIMLPRLQSMDNGNELKIMGRIVLFMTSELLRRVRNHLAFLHENTT